MKQFQQTISSLVAFESKEGDNGIRKLRKNLTPRYFKKNFHKINTK